MENFELPGGALSFCRRNKRRKMSAKISIKKEKRMNKAGLVGKIAGDTGLAKRDARNVVDAVVETVTDALVTGQKVTLVGFGSFDVIQRKARRGRNPQTGEELQIPARKVPRFRPGNSLRERIK